MTARTKYDVCSNALISIGANAVTSFTSGGTESDVCNQLWIPVYQNCLTLHDWRFAMKQATLVRNGSAPTALWSASYAAPTGMLLARNVTVGDVPIEYDRYEANIYCNATSSDVVHIDYIFDCDVQYWPPYFATFVEVALMKKFAFALAAKLDLMGSIDKDLETQFRLARHADSRQQSAKRLPLSRGSIMQARRS